MAPQTENKKIPPLNWSAGLCEQNLKVIILITYKEMMASYTNVTLSMLFDNSAQHTQHTRELLIENIIDESSFQMNESHTISSNLPKLFFSERITNRDQK